MCVVSKVRVFFCVLYTKQNDKIDRHAGFVQCSQARVTVKRIRPSDWNRRLSGRDGNAHRLTGINKFKQPILDHLFVVLNQSSCREDTHWGQEV